LCRKDPKRDNGGLGALQPFEFLGPVQVADIAVEHAIAIEEHGGARL